jgi:two-component system CheB/CheR fusion protein
MRTKKKISKETTEKEPSADPSESAGFPIVGIGASAGGLAAFEAFFRGMPEDGITGMAYILIQHLAPDHKSMLAEIISRFTKMKVFEVVDGMKVAPGCVYIIPPDRDMALLNGSLQLIEPSGNRHQRLPIDFFFRSLAQDQGSNAICIILSGTGTDGTLGLKLIKGEGGLAIVQSPESAEYQGMPSSATSTGLVDFILPPSEMAEKLISYVTHTSERLPQDPDSHIQLGENLRNKIFVLLRAQTGHDFSQYKPGTISRRIERRMAVQQINSLDRYVRYLQQYDEEVKILFRDLLIGVTSFFRDPEFFSTFANKVIPGLFGNKPPGSLIRVWVAGCSTGEEAYSIAILLHEYMEVVKESYLFQVFATDIDSNAISIARAGIYPSSIIADVTPERLSRFFVANTETSTYRINKTIRDTLVFSEQDLIKDPPFSRIDLISCRNLLIYMSGNLQKKLIPLFHYALNPGGILFLGSSESIGDFSEIFSVIDRKVKLYKRKEDFNRKSIESPGQFLSSRTLPGLTDIRTPGKSAMTIKVPLREITEQTLLQQIEVAGILVNSRGDIIYLHGHTGKFLELSQGEAGINNILKMARTGLRHDLTVSLHKAVVSNQLVQSKGIRISDGDNLTLVNLKVCPVQKGVSTDILPGINPFADSPLFLIILEESMPQIVEAKNLPTSTLHKNLDTDAQILALNQELLAKEEYLQSAEELQSINEELATVNAELHNKVVDLSRVNNDMNNLLAGTGIGTVFIDHQLRILRYTPAATHIINLIPGDVNRPVAHVVSNLIGYNNMAKDAETVLDTLIPKEVEVQTSVGKFYMMRILPYRTLDNVIEGAVITFTDITEVKMAHKIQKESEIAINRLGIIVNESDDALTVIDLTGRFLAWNPAATRIYGWTESEALSMNIRDMLPLQQQSIWQNQVQELREGRIMKTYEAGRLDKDGSMISLWITSTALINKDGEIYAIATKEKTEDK